MSLRARVNSYRVLIGENGTAFTQYEMEITQRIEVNDTKSAIQITRKSGDPEQKSNFEIKTTKLRFGVKDLFQILMFYCTSFTDDDIPDKLWQEAEYGIN